MEIHIGRRSNRYLSRSEWVGERVSETRRKISGTFESRRRVQVDRRLYGKGGGWRGSWGEEDGVFGKTDYKVLIIPIYCLIGV